MKSNFFEIKKCREGWALIYRKNGKKTIIDSKINHKKGLILRRMSDEELIKRYKLGH